MQIYSLSNQKEPANDSRNIFALRWDLLSSLFDKEKWVVVPKDGQMVVHFIDQSYETAALYHNKMFDTAHSSHEFLFARFAWAIIEQVRSAVPPMLRKRFRLTIPTSESAVNDPQEEGSVDMNQKEKKRKLNELQVESTQGANRKGKRKAMDVVSLDGNNDFLS